LSNDSKKQWTKRRGAQPVSDLVSKLLDPVIERRAGMTMDLVASWDEIVGQRHASQTRPEKLHWPRQANDDDPFEPATLVVACDGGHAVFFQHDSAHVIARVNSYFGFAAVARLKLLQKPVENSPAKVRPSGDGLSPRANADLESMLQSVDNEELKSALKKMGQGVFSRSSSKDR